MLVVEFVYSFCLGWLLGAFRAFVFTGYWVSLGCVLVVWFVYRSVFILVLFSFSLCMLFFLVRLGF